RLRSESSGRTWRQLWLGRVVAAGRGVLLVLLASWMGLILWLAFTPGGPAPPEKTDPNLFRVITWNIHCGQEEGLPWKQCDWPTRKHALRSALEEAHPDILCVQEATPDQVVFLEQALPDHRRVGGGRDDGKSAGEHCAIFFRRKRFAEQTSGTFWL